MSWPIMELGDLCERVSVGHVGKTSDFYTDESGIPFLRTQNVSLTGVNTNDIKYITADFHKQLKKSTLSTGDLILSRVISTRINCGIVPKELDGSNCANIILIRPKKGLLDVHFLNHYLSSGLVQNNLLKRQVGSAQSVVNTKVLKSWEIPIPPLPEQQKIAAILDAVDSLRQKDQQLVDHYTVLSQSLFLDMFGDPVTNPMGWDIASLEQVCKQIHGGGTPSKSVPEYYVGDIPWVTPKDMKTHYIYNSIDHINIEAIQNSSTKLIHSGAVLMVIRSGVLKHTLPLAINVCDVTVNQDLKAFIPCLEYTNSHYLFHYFKGVEGYLLGKVRAVTADNIEFRQIKELPFPKPPIELQNQFAEHIEVIEQQKQQAQASLKKSEDLFNSLLQRAFKGELTRDMAA